MSSCFGATPATPAYYSPSSSYYASSSSGRPWRWWRARCAGIAAAVGASLRRSLSLHKRRMGRRDMPGRRRRRHTPSAVHHYAHHHHRSFAPVYVDDLYAHHQYLQCPQPAAAKPITAVLQEQEPSTSGAGKLASAAASPVRAHAAAAAAGAAAATRGRATTGGKPAATAAAATTMRPKKPSSNAALLRSPGRGGVLCGVVVKGMGEVDLRAELFIRKFKEDMRLQSQRSAEELQAMLARGL